MAKRKKFVEEHRKIITFFMKSAKFSKCRKIKILSGFFGLFVVIFVFLFCNFSGQNAGSLLTGHAGLDMLFSSMKNGDRTA
ncbi:MAG: hypothetical protein IJL51_00570 [Oscillospiraceae bacterium]|nr:hypothetical protein [Oscillospiraceae bacterium]